MKRSKNESQCFGGIAEKREVFVSGTNTQVRLSVWKTCTDESQVDCSGRTAREKNLRFDGTMFSQKGRKT